MKRLPKMPTISDSCIAVKTWNLAPKTIQSYAQSRELAGYVERSEKIDFANFLHKKKVLSVTTP